MEVYYRGRKVAERVGNFLLPYGSFERDLKVVQFVAERLSTPLWEFLARLYSSVDQHHYTERGFLLPYGSFKALDQMRKVAKVEELLSTPLWEFLQGL